MELEKVKGEILAKISALAAKANDDIIWADAAQVWANTYCALCQTGSYDRMIDAAVNGELNSGVLE